jgi:hypothetical protein
MVNTGHPPRTHFEASAHIEAARIRQAAETGTYETHGKIYTQEGTVIVTPSMTGTQYNVTKEGISPVLGVTAEYQVSKEGKLTPINRAGLPSSLQYQKGIPTVPKKSRQEIDRSIVVTYGKTSPTTYGVTGYERVPTQVDYKNTFVDVTTGQPYSAMEKINPSDVTVSEYNKRVEEYYNRPDIKAKIALEEAGKNKLTEAIKKRESEGVVFAKPEEVPAWSTPLQRIAYEVEKPLRYVQAKTEEYLPYKASIELSPYGLLTGTGLISIVPTSLAQKRDEILTRQSLQTINPSTKSIIPNIVAPTFTMKDNTSFGFKNLLFGGKSIPIKETTYGKIVSGIEDVGSYFVSPYGEIRIATGLGAFGEKGYIGAENVIKTQGISALPSAAYQYAKANKLEVAGNIIIGLGALGKVSGYAGNIFKTLKGTKVAAEEITTAEVIAGKKFPTAPIPEHPSIYQSGKYGLPILQDVKKVIEYPIYGLKKVIPESVKTYISTKELQYKSDIQYYGKGLSLTAKELTYPIYRAGVKTSETIKPTLSYLETKASQAKFGYMYYEPKLALTTKQLQNVITHPITSTYESLRQKGVKPIESYLQTKQLQYGSNVQYYGKKGLIAEKQLVYAAKRPLTVTGEFIGTNIIKPVKEYKQIKSLQYKSNIQYYTPKVVMTEKQLKYAVESPFIRTGETIKRKIIKPTSSLLQTKQLQYGSDIQYYGKGLSLSAKQLPYIVKTPFISGYEQLGKRIEPIKGYLQSKELQYKSEYRYNVPRLQLSVKQIPYATKQPFISTYESIGRTIKPSITYLETKGFQYGLTKQYYTRQGELLGKTLLYKAETPFISAYEQLGKKLEPTVSLLKTKAFQYGLTKEYYQRGLELTAKSIEYKLNPFEFKGMATREIIEKQIIGKEIGGYHLTPQAFKLTEASAGSSEVAGLYVSAPASFHFAGINPFGKGSEPSFGLKSLIPSFKGPKAYFIKPTAFVNVPAEFRVGPFGKGVIGPESEFISKQAVKGVGYILLRKPEIEAVLPELTKFKELSSNLYTIWKRVRIPIGKYTTATEEQVSVVLKAGIKVDKSLLTAEQINKLSLSYGEGRSVYPYLMLSSSKPVPSSVSVTSSISKVSAPSIPSTLKSIVSKISSQTLSYSGSSSGISLSSSPSGPSSSISSAIKIPSYKYISSKKIPPYSPTISPPPSKKSFLSSAIKKIQKSKAFELFVKKKGKFVKVKQPRDLTKG